MWGLPPGRYVVAPRRPCSGEVPLFLLAVPTGPARASLRSHASSVAPHSGVPCHNMSPTFLFSELQKSELAAVAVGTVPNSIPRQGYSVHGEPVLMRYAQVVTLPLPGKSRVELLCRRGHQCQTEGLHR